MYVFIRSRLDVNCDVRHTRKYGPNENRGIDYIFMEFVISMLGLSEESCSQHVVWCVCDLGECKCFSLFQKCIHLFLHFAVLMDLSILNRLSVFKCIV